MTTQDDLKDRREKLTLAILRLDEKKRAAFEEHIRPLEEKQQEYYRLRNILDLEISVSDADITEAEKIVPKEEPLEK